MNYKEKFLSSYIECALWSSTDESTPQGGEPLDSNYSSNDLTAECRERMKTDCDDFMGMAGPLLDGIDADEAGHYFQRVYVDDPPDYSIYPKQPAAPPAAPAQCVCSMRDLMSNGHASTCAWAKKG